MFIIIIIYVIIYVLYIILMMDTPLASYDDGIQGSSSDSI